MEDFKKIELCPHSQFCGGCIHQGVPYEQQLAAKEQRFADQTEVLRTAQRELLEMTVENGKLAARIAALEAERAMKLCERKGCAQRQPQSGY